MNKTRHQPPQRKFITQNQMTGQKGINLIEAVVMDMGYTWTPTSGANDAGIDGIIEIRDPATGEATNLIVQVQSKATEQAWEAETPTSCVYRVRPKDLSYWLQGNAPVILVICRPRTKEAYWVPIKPYFQSPERKAACKITFDKTTQKFDKAAAGAIAGQALPTEQGIYLRPPPIDELLTANLLEVDYYPKTLYIAETPYSTSVELRTQLKKLDQKPGSLWFVRKKRILSFHDLGNFPWTKVTEPGTVETFETNEWALSYDQEKQNDFVRLLNQTLRIFVFRKDIGIFAPKGKKNVYYFEPSEHTDKITNTVQLKERWETWKQEKTSARTVVQIYKSKKDPNRVIYYRHHAFTGQFSRFDKKWFLEITPTYHYTTDGENESPFRESNLAGMKRLEGHQSVANNVKFIAYFLTQSDLLRREYHHLRFGKLLEFQTDFGIPESDWKNRADPDEEIELQPGVDPQMTLLPE